MIATDRLSARVGTFALADVTFEIPSGAYGVVIGPTGSGKTTLLEVLAGLVPQSGGELRLNGRDVAAEPAECRSVGLVYQHGFLFPHLSVAENVRYGAADAGAAGAVAARLGADRLYSRSVGELSGGERQIVALARALARRPEILLLDEPFSALDPPRRDAARRAVRELHREWKLTTLHVTHDFAEAGSIGDVAILLDAGRVLQHGAPEDVFRRPRTPYVAEFLGAENIFCGSVGASNGEAIFLSGSLRLYVAGNAARGPCHAIVRPEEILVAREAPAPSSARNVFGGQVTGCVSTGPIWKITLDVGGARLVAAVTTHSMDELALDVGSTAHFVFKASAVHLC